MVDFKECYRIKPPTDFIYFFKLKMTLQTIVCPILKELICFVMLKQSFKYNQFMCFLSVSRSMVKKNGEISLFKYSIIHT